MLGWPELVLIFVVLLLVVGPSKMPEMARTLGQVMREFRKATDELENTAIAESSTAGYALPVMDGPTAAPSDATSTGQSKNQSAPEVQKGLEDLARELGIEIEGRSKEQLRKEILEKVYEMEKNALGGELNCQD